MAGPILHHRASGIHPGAFVASTAPITTDLLDHVLWIDTSSGPPYQLKLWDQSSATWQLVGIVSTLPSDCLTFPEGASICNDVVDTIHYNTPSGQHAMDASGYQLPGGHRLEVVTP